MSKDFLLIKLTRDVVSSILTFKTTVDIQKYVMTKTDQEFREFEHEVSQNNPIKGAGLLADRTNILTKARDGGRGFYLDNMDVGSHELGEHIGLYPFAAASASFVFTKIEAYGDDVVEVVNPGALGGSRSWHQDIKDRYDFRDTVQSQKARKAFANYFLADWNSVPEIAAARIVSLKKQRNEFAHQGTGSISFNDFVGDALAVVCHIAFLTTGIDRISSYPWEDYHDTFSPQT